MSIERLALPAMGTRFELVLAGAPARDLRAAGEEALESIAELHRLWSVFDRGSLLTRVNRLAAERPVAIDGETLALLQLARELWAATGGAFDPTLGARMRAAGFRGTRRAAGAAHGGPAPSPGMAAVEFDERAGTVRFLERGIELDLGGIAKGYALDRAGERLRAAGIGCALLHGGTSSAVAIGAPPDAEGWSIALDSEGRRPRVRLRDAALGVSGAGGRIIRAADGDGSGADRGHILDPATGRSAPLDSWAAVVADSAAHADSWSTALVAVDRRTPSTVLVAVDRRTPSTVLVAVDRTTPSTALVAVDRTTPSTALVAVDRRTSAPALAGAPRRAPAAPVALQALPGDPPPEMSWLAAAGGRPIERCDPRGVFAG